VGQTTHGSNTSGRLASLRHLTTGTSHKQQTIPTAAKQTDAINLPSFWSLAPPPTQWTPVSLRPSPRTHPVDWSRQRPPNVRSLAIRKLSRGTGHGTGQARTRCSYLCRTHSQDTDRQKRHDQPQTALRRLGQSKAALASSYHHQRDIGATATDRAAMARHYSARLRPECYRLCAAQLHAP